MQKELQTGSLPSARVVSGNGESVSVGRFVVSLLSHFEQNGLKSVFLRNYENLPESIGNDVDLLIEDRKTQDWIDAVAKFAPKFGWQFLRSVEFGCASVFLFRPDANEIFHIDLNERLEWHCVPLTDERTLFSRRIMSNGVFIPSPEDELYLNIVTRLVFKGVVRENHREQWGRLRPRCAEDVLFSVFCETCSPFLARTIIHCADVKAWDRVESLKNGVRFSALKKALLHNFARFSDSVFRYASRAATRFFKPPGPVFSFAKDGVDSRLMADALRLASAHLSRWGNMSKCLLESGNVGRSLIKSLRRRLFLARNGVLCQIVPFAGAGAGRSSLHAEIRISALMDGTWAEEKLAEQMIRGVRNEIARQVQGKIA